MKIAELFVNLGVKGNDSADRALKGVKTGLGDVKSMGLETKAMIAAVVYGLERMMSQSAQMGTGLINFASLTGISAKSLQQWQYAARQAGVSGEELTGSLKAVQNSMTNMLLGKGAPEGMAMLANKVGFDPKRARDTLYVMQQLQKFAQQVPQDVGNSMLKSFGLGEGTIAAMRRNMFTDANFKKAPTYSDGEIGSLNRADVAWANLGQKIQMAFGHLTAKHGTSIVGDLAKITDSVLKLADALIILSEKWGVFQAMGHVLEGIANTAKLLVEITDKVGGKQSKKGDLLYSEGEMFPGLSDSPVGKLFKSLTSGSAASPPVDVSKIPVPAMPQNINVNQTLNFQHDGKDAKKTGSSVHKAVKDAYRQMSAQSQGS